jgi:hypothetical protein
MSSNSSIDELLTPIFTYANLNKLSRLALAPAEANQLAGRSVAATIQRS